MPRKRRQLGGIDRLRSGRYRVRVTDEATGERLSLGTYVTKADAEQALARAIADQGRGRWVQPDAGSVLFEDYARQWVASRLGRNGAPLRPRVRELYESQLRLHILPSLGRVPIGKLRPPTIRSWYAALPERGPGASTVAKCYRLLHAILNTAVDDGILAANPCSIRGAGAENAAERKLPTLGQVHELADRVDPRYRALVLAAAFSGLRRGELFGLRREHIDLDDGTVTVEVQRQQLSNGQHLVGPPKSDAGVRTVALPREVVGELADHLASFVGLGVSPSGGRGDSQKARDRLSRSRSMRSWAHSARSSASSARSSPLSPSRSPRSMRSLATQFPSVPSFTPSDRAVSAIVRPSSSTIATASRRNSGGYFEGRPRARLLLLDMDSSYTRCPSNGGIPSPEPSVWVFTGAKGGPLREAVWQTEWERARESVGRPPPRRGHARGGDRGRRQRDHVPHRALIAAGRAALPACDPTPRPLHRRRHLQADHAPTPRRRPARGQIVRSRLGHDGFRVTEPRRDRWPEYAADQGFCLERVTGIEPA